jgi:hypothetical protein
MKTTCTNLVVFTFFFSPMVIKTLQNHFFHILFLISLFGKDSTIKKILDIINWKEGWGANGPRLL